MTTESSRWLCPVWGVEVSAPIRLLGIQDPVLPTVEFQLIPMPDAVLHRLSGIAAHLPISSMQLHQARAVIETNAPPVFGNEPCRVLGLQICGLALSLWCERIAIPFCVLTGDPGSPSSGTSWAGHDPFVPEGLLHNASIDAKSAETLPVIASRIAEHFHHIAGTALRFYWAGHKPFELDAFLDYAIAAEALLCRGATEEIGATFRRRAARLLSAADENMAPKRADSIYALRSKIVHGDDRAIEKALRPWSGDQMSARRDARAFTRDVLVAMLLDPSLIAAAGLSRLDV